MLTFKLRYVIAYAHQFESEIESANITFFQNHDPDSFDADTVQRLQALFNEYIAFEHKTSKGSTFAAEYYLKNPDHRPFGEIDELRQVVETQHYEPFEIISKNPGKTITVYGLYSGKQYQVTDILASKTAPEYGTSYNRIARVNRRWYFVGNDPVVFPITQSPRSKKKLIMTPKQLQQVSCREYKDLLISQAESPPEEIKIYTPKEIKNKRKELIRKYQKIAKKNHIAVPVETIIDFIYHESYQHNTADYVLHLHTKLGLPESVPLSNLQLFQDFWNFFPHQSLIGKSPAEKYAEYYGTSKR